MEAFEIEPSYNEDPFPRGPRVLWGRVAALGGALILFFLLGHATGGGGGSSQQVTTLQKQVDQDRTQIAQLQQSLASVSQSPATGPTSGGGLTTSPVPTSGPTSTLNASPTPAGNGQTYKVKAGDTLGSIAVKFYGRAGHDLVALIEQANGMADSTVHVGQVLTIPPNPNATGSGTTATATPKPTASATPKPTASATPGASASPTG